MSGHSCSHTGPQCKGFTNSGLNRSVADGQAGRSPPEAQPGHSGPRQRPVGPADHLDMADVEAQTRALAHETDSAASYRQSQPVLLEWEQAGGVAGAGLEQPEPANQVRPKRLAGE